MARAYSETSSSPGFHSILHNFHKMIFEIIYCKTVSWIFLTFCRLHFINNFEVKNNFSEPWDYQKLNISRRMYFKEISGHRFQDLICTNNVESKLFKSFFNFFPKTWSSFKIAKHVFGREFFAQKSNFILFFKSDYIVLTQY